VDFALQPKAIQQMYLKECVHVANNHKNEHRKQHRKKKVSSKSKGNPCYFRFSVFLGSIDLQICMQAFQNLFGLFQKSWKMLVDDCSTYYLGPILHGKSGRRNRYLSSLKTVEPSVIEFLTNVSRFYGEAFATQFVQDVTGMSLRKEEEGLIELPSSFTKRKLYMEYCFERGHKVKTNAKGSYGKVSLYSPRPFDDVLWPQGSQPLPVCCWMDFLIIWKKELPFLRSAILVRIHAVNVQRFRTDFIFWKK
jgi:hypothetical protein